MDEGQPGAPLLEARGVSMSFPGVRALDAVDFDVRAGEVHAVVGENGAGKSTLIRVLSGELSGYEGEVRIGGRPVRFRSPRDGIAAGIAVIPQELLLVSSLPADANIFLGREPRSRAGLIDRPRLAALAAAALAELGEDTLPRVPVGRLAGGTRQLVAIARALSLEARLIIMDEPTTALGPIEVARLEVVVRRLAARGVAVVYISHRLDEVRRLARRVTVLRDGRRVATVSAERVDEPELVRLMVGRAVAGRTAAPLGRTGEILLRVEDLSVPDPAQPTGYRLRGVSFDVGRGEIVGVSGLVGAGRSELLLALAGALDRPVGGRVWLAGKSYRPTDPASARALGVVLLPEDRKTQGIFPSLSLQANLTVGRLDRVSRLGFVQCARESAASDRLMRDAGMRAASPAVPIATLSGGNQQKALLARCLFASPSVLLLDEPTRGIDVAARAEVHQTIAGLAESGYAVLLCSSDLPEILALCHRICVFRQGRLVDTFRHDEATEERVMAAATGAAGRPAASASVAVGDGTAGTPRAAATAAAGGTMVGPTARATNATGSDTGDAARDAASDATRPAGSPPAPPAPGGARARRPSSVWRFASAIGLAAVVLLAVLVSPVRGGRPVFLELGNLTDILRQVAEKGILAAGMTAVIISGGIDLSVGSVLALAATLAGLLLMHAGLGVAATSVLVLLAGAAVGLLNGAVTARWRIQPFIVTLATMSAARGVARYISGGAAIPLGFGPEGAPASFQRLAAPVVPYVPMPAVFFLISIAAIHVFLSRMAAGRYVYAIGDNEPAAHLSGIRVARYKVLVYVIAGALAALAGLIHCAQLEQGNPNDGVSYELDAIAAVVIGGTSLAGGVGSVGGTLVGTLIIGIINNSMGLNNVDANVQLILKGAIILGAVWLQTRRR